MNVDTRSSPARHGPAPQMREAPPPSPDLGDAPSEAGMQALGRICRASGGIARGDDLGRLLEDCHCGHFVDLARLIVRREILAFDWRGSLWVPMFQFDLRDLSVHPAMRRVLAGVDAAVDGWTLAVWFAQPHGAMQGRRPLELLNLEPETVVRAARADHPVAQRRAPSQDFTA